MPGIRVRDMFATFKSLSGRDKLQYAWDYFRYPILVIVFLVLFFGSMLVQCASYRKPYIQAIVINPNKEVNTQESWFDAYLSDRGYEYFEGCVNISGFTISNGENFFRDENYTAMAILLNAEYDLFIGNGTVYENVAQQGGLADLSQLLPEQVLSSYEGRILYCNVDGTEEPYPCAIFLEDNPWVTVTGCYPEGCYFAICGQSADPQAAADLAMYILSQN